MDPEADKLRQALDKKLRKSESAATYLDAAGAALKLLVSLDHGMIDGAVVPANRRAILTAEAQAFASAQFDNALRLDRARAGRWLSSIPVYDRPKSFDPADWARRAATAKDPRPAPAALDPSSPEVPRPLSKALKALIALGRAHPDLHRLGAPASEAMIQEREQEMGVETPSELKLLYRSFNGFSLFLERGSSDDDTSGFRMVPLHELQPFALTVGDEVPKRRSRRARGLKAAINDPARLQVFDVGNGDFVSCSPVGEAGLVWIDDHSDGPERALTASVVELLDYVMSPDRIDPETKTWTHSAWQGLAL